MVVAIAKTPIQLVSKIELGDTGKGLVAVRSHVLLPYLAPFGVDLWADIVEMPHGPKDLVDQLKHGGD